MSWYNDVYQFNFPTVIRFGKDVSAEVPGHLKSMKLAKPLIVTDPGLEALPVFKNFQKNLESNDLRTTVFSGIDKNPVFANVEAGTATYKESSCDSIIGFGGGAAMDVARTIAMRVNHGGPLEDYIEENSGDEKITNDIPYFITIPTTSGTGSEVGRSSVISDDKTHAKKIFFHPSLLAKRVFADPVLTMELPAHITAATGVDAFVHNLEAFFAKGFHPMCEGIALEGMKLVKESLVSATLKPDLEARTKMMAAATMGAVAFQKGLGVIHSTAHSLSTHFDLHHGLANAIMLPHGLRFNLTKCQDKAKQVEKYLEIGDLVGFCEQLLKDLSIKPKLSDYGITEAGLDDLTATAFLDVCHQCNPISVSKEDFKKIYTEAL